MELPDPEVAPVILPIVEPMVHVKVLGTDADKVIEGLVPLQIATELSFVTKGVGFTVTVIV